MRRGESFAGRSKRKTHCPHGHPYSPENTVKVKQPHGWARLCATCYPSHARCHGTVASNQAQGVLA